MVGGVNFIMIKIVQLYIKRQVKMNLTVMENLTDQTELAYPSSSQTVILWGPENLLAGAVEFFLKTKVDWEVIRISFDRGVDYLVQQVHDTKPDVVILCQETDSGDPALLAQLDQIQFCLKVVTVSMESNRIQVYSKQTVMMRDVSDLLAVVET
jgi:hypothetical protein